jgi:glyoxylase-like metal-dependent hydrolase (beta-lactamase superfamily II)
LPIAYCPLPKNMSNSLESALHYPFGEALPGSGQTLEVAPGVRWLRMPLPFALNHINLWMLRDRQDGQDGWTLVDCGFASSDTRAAWEQIFATQLQGLPVLRVVCTHMHPDHIGLAQWLTERFSTAQHECRLWISATDWGVARWLCLRQDDRENSAQFYIRHGLQDNATLAQVRGPGHQYADMVSAVPARYRRLLHGMVLDVAGQAWHCIAGYGHAPEHIALHCPALNVLIAGDMVLPRISTNVSVHDVEPEANPLALYLASIEGLRSLPADTLVLPSHGKPFVGLHTRIGQLQDHHAERFVELLSACAQAPQSAADLLPVLFKRSLDAHQTTFAMGEAVAHLHALAAEGRLRLVPGSDGVRRYASV